LNGSIRRRRTSQRRASEKSEKEANQEKQTSKLTETEEAGTGSVGFSVYLNYFKSIGIFLSVLAIFSNAANTGAGIYGSSRNIDILKITN
jgi:hypothetical protein